MRIFLSLLWLVGSGFAAHAGDGVPDADILENPVKNYSTITSDIATSGSINQHNLEELHQHGVQQIIDLREPREGTDEEQQWAADAGVDYVNLPVTRGKLPDDELVIQIGALLDQAGDKPTLLHCSSGNRAGIVLALYYHQRGESVEQALDRARAAGARKSVIPALRKRLSNSEQ